EKVNPYLRPLYDALHDLVDFDRARKLVERGTIEVAPLAFMRGRTLNDSFVILDEAQNTTTEQMKMFLTRLGYGSKAVVTGDVTQIDLPQGKASGLKEAAAILRGIPGIRFITFTERDVVRAPRRRRDLGRCRPAPGGGARRDARTRGGPALDPRAPPPPRLRPRALGGRGASDAAARARARTMAVAVGSNGMPMVAVAERPW